MAHAHVGVDGATAILTVVFTQAARLVEGAATVTIDGAAVQRVEWSPGLLGATACHLWTARVELPRAINEQALQLTLERGAVLAACGTQAPVYTGSVSFDAVRAELEHGARARCSIEPLTDIVFLSIN